MDKTFPILLPAAYLPPIQWFVYLLAAGRVLIEQHETYPKQTYRNRCEIATANGSLALTIPVIKVHGNHTKTKDIAISGHQNWQVLHWRALVAAYANSPYFMFYQDDFEPFFQMKYDNLLQFNLELLELVVRLLEVGKAFELTSDFEQNPTGLLDLRNEITPKKPFTHFPLPEYTQVFQEKTGFIPGLSIVDLLFNKGPESIGILRNLADNMNISRK
jgi:hypothetical protein